MTKLRWLIGGQIVRFGCFIERIGDSIGGWVEYEFDFDIDDCDCENCC